MNELRRDRVWVGWMALGLALVLGLLSAGLWAGGLAWTNAPAAARQLSVGEQGALVLAVYPVKALYMLAALGLLAALRREGGRPWLALRGSLAAFLVGEFFCAINILFFEEEALIFEYLHSLFMVYCVGLVFYAALEAVDESVLHYSNPKARCALAGVCKTCVKGVQESSSRQERKACLLHSLFCWMVPLGALLAFMPLMAQPLDYAFNTLVFGQPRVLTHLMAVQWYEMRFSPLAALALMLVSWAVLVWRGHTPAGLHLSKILLSMGVGQLGFTFMRVVFAAFYRDALVWFVFWEELTELMLVGGMLVVVLLVRPGLFKPLQALVKGI